MSELKPCPFCGTSGETEERAIGFSVQCVDCGNVFTNWRETRKEAIDEWNTRTTDDQLTTITKQRDELLKCLEVVNAHAVYRAGTFNNGETVAQYSARILSTIKEQKDAE